MEVHHSMPEPEDEEAPAPAPRSSHLEPSHGIAGTLRRRWPEYVIEAAVIILSISLSYGLEAWREARHTHHLEQVYLHTLRDNLSADKGALEKVIGETKTVLANARELAALPLNTPVPPEAVRADLMQVIQRPSFMAHDAAFSNLRNGGGLGAIRDFALKNDLFDYYRDVDSIHATETAEKEVLISVIGPYLMRSLRLIASSSSPADLADIHRIVGTTEFQNSMWVRVQNREELLRKYEDSLREAEALTGRIAKQLDE